VARQRRRTKHITEWTGLNISMWLYELLKTDSDSSAPLIDNDNNMKKYQHHCQHRHWMTTAVPKGFPLTYMANSTDIAAFCGSLVVMQW